VKHEVRIVEQGGPPPRYFFRCKCGEIGTLYSDHPAAVAQADEHAPSLATAQVARQEVVDSLIKLIDAEKSLEEAGYRLRSRTPLLELLARACEVRIDALSEEERLTR